MKISLQAVQPQKVAGDFNLVIKEITSIFDYAFAQEVKRNRFLNGVQGL